MVVGFDATTLAGRISGVGYYTARLLERLANGAGEGVVDRVVVLSNREVDVGDRGKLEVHRAHRFGVRCLWMQLALPWALRGLRPDVVHFTNYLAPVMGAARYVVSFHDMSLSIVPECHTLKKRVLTSSLIPHVARHARLILTPSHSTRRDVMRILGVESARLRVIPYAASPAFRPTPGGAERLARLYGAREPYFLYVGTLEPRKNLPRALRAFARIAPSLPEHRFVIVGQKGWKYGEVLREAARPVLAGRVAFAGYAPEQDLPQLYTNATGFVYPSLYEGFGLPVVEAMSCGAPVLTSRSSSMAEIGEGAALLADPEDEAALADALHALATDRALREDLRARGLRRAAAFSWDRTARETVAAYQEACDGGLSLRRPPNTPSPRLPRSAPPSCQVAAASSRRPRDPRPQSAGQL